MSRNLDCIKVFRNSLVAQLKAANISGVEQNVYAARVEKAWPEEEAFIVVGIPQVNFEDKRTSPRSYSASADVNVDIFASAFGVSLQGHKHNAAAVDSMADFLDDTAKAVCELVDVCQNSKGPFNGTVKRCVLKSFTNNLSEGETVRGAMRIVFGIEFSLSINNSSPTDEFLKAENTLKMGAGDANQQEFVTNLRP